MNAKFNFLVIALLAIGLTLSSCGPKSASGTTIEQTTKQGKEYTSAYVCPMHCDDSGSDSAGKCPVCGMDYVKNEDHNSDNHKH